MKPAWLVLRDGRTFRGRSLGAAGEASGEVIFNTAMQGYRKSSPIRRIGDRS